MSKTYIFCYGNTVFFENNFNDLKFLNQDVKLKDITINNKENYSVFTLEFPKQKQVVISLEWSSMYIIITSDTSPG